MIGFRLLRPIMRPIMRWFKVFSYDTYCIVGSSGRLVVGEKVALGNTLINVSSGSVYIGDFVIFGSNVMLLTGRHLFIDGERAGLSEVVSGGSWGGGESEVPGSGYDISIGKGSWIASGAIISGGVTIGCNSLVCAGAVVTRNVLDYEIVAGVPAKKIGDTRNSSRG